MTKKIAILAVLMKKILILIFLTFVAFTTFADEKSVHTLALLQGLSDDASIWSGTTGANNISKMNRALSSAANNLGPSEASLLYTALRPLTNGINEQQFRDLMGDDFIVFTNSYVDTMLLMEAGVRPQVIVAIINEVIRKKPVGSYVFYFMELLNLPQDAAESLVKIANTHSAFLINPQF
jgi:hypothetical protein